MTDKGVLSDSLHCIEKLCFLLDNGMENLFEWSESLESLKCVKTSGKGKNKHFLLIEFSQW